MATWASGGVESGIGPTASVAKSLTYTPPSGVSRDQGSRGPVTGVGIAVLAKLRAGACPPAEVGGLALTVGH